MSENRYVTEESLNRFQGFLQQEERSAGTIEKYMRDVKNFAAWIKEQSSVPSGFSCCEVTKDIAIRWKQYLLQSGRAPSTVNSMLAAVNTYFKFMCWQDLRIKAIRLQKSFFRSSDRELTKTEYEKLIFAARRKGDEQMVLLMETICATGIRVSEVCYITREAAAKGRTPSLDLPFSAPGILVIQGCRTDLIGDAPTIDSSLTGLIPEITMKPGEIDMCYKGFHLQTCGAGQ